MICRVNEQHPTSCGNNLNLFKIFIIIIDFPFKWMNNNLNLFRVCMWHSIAQASTISKANFKIDFIYLVRQYILIIFN
jgi:hypothetical protein